MPRIFASVLRCSTAQHCLEVFPTTNSGQPPQRFCRPSLWVGSRLAGRRGFTHSCGMFTLSHAGFFVFPTACVTQVSTAAFIPLCWVPLSLAPHARLTTMTLFGRTFPQDKPPQGGYTGQSLNTRDSPERSSSETVLCEQESDRRAESWKAERKNPPPKNEGSLPPYKK